MALLTVVALASAAWVGFTASTISRELNAANAIVPDLRSNLVKGNSAAAQSAAEELMQHTAKARGAASDPLWIMAGAIPGIGVNFEATAEIATSADDIARLGAAPLVGVFSTIDWKSLKTNGEGLDLKPLAAAHPKLASAAQAVRQSSDRLNAIDANKLMPQIASPLAGAREELDSLRDGLDSASDVAKILPTMMGDETPRSYLLLIQNNAELRATGGIPGALAVLRVHQGKLSLGAQSSASAMGIFNPRVDVDPEQQAIFSTRLGKFMQDVNLTPDFPTAAKTAKSMWEMRSGQKVDGVLSVDPVALGYMLEATGPIQLTDQPVQDLSDGALPLELTAKNIVPTLLSDVYAKINEPELQDAYFAGVAEKVFAKLSTGSGDTAKLIDGLTRSAEEHRLQVWSADADDQAVISKYPLGGSVTGGAISPAQFGVYFNDGTGAKMDYHVKRTVQLFTQCPADGYTEVKVRVTSTNTAPKDAATSLPTYVTGGGIFGVPAGIVQTNVTAYGPVQSNIESALVGQQKTGFASNRHASRPVGSLTVRLAPGESKTVEFTFGKIVQSTAPKLSVTPTVQAQKDVILAPQAAECAPAA
ncbi:DUF4012 domain-containing protein [Arthrobacter sp. UC242_113]|uniref:DUF4012 domain-containing protein n=1 Tax=Arthrobacter sp. UC242_113 TaxID=3374550 RepID=UPI0037570AE6